jgi:hypothetical protein
VHVCAHNGASHYAFRTIAIALANFDRTEGHAIGSWNGPTSMVFEPGEWAEFNEAVGSCEPGVGSEEFTNGARAINSDGFTVK